MGEFHKNRQRFLQELAFSVDLGDSRIGMEKGECYSIVSGEKRTLSFAEFKFVVDRISELEFDRDVVN